jgi:hypothetical protein
MEPNLATTNVLLGIMAAVSVLEAVLIIGTGIAAVIVYRRVSELIATLEARHVAPVAAHVNAILGDVRGITSRVKEETERVDQAIRTTIDRVDDTADRMRSNVRAKASWLVGFVRGLRVALAEMLTTPTGPRTHHAGTDTRTM